MEKNNKIFGSCWGLQVLVTAAGGKIRKNPNGLEAIIAKNICSFSDKFYSSLNIECDTYISKVNKKGPSII